MKKTILLLSILAFVVQGVAQLEDSLHAIMFYNVENLFHPTDDSLKLDDDFTPTGSYHWTYKKYRKKISMIGKVIVALGRGDPPWIVGLAEIENEQVLNDLCYNSPLKKYNYKFVHFESPDRRGVDVALLYRDSCVEIMSKRAIPVQFPFDTNSRNRDILYAVAKFPSGDSIYLFVNHWTSRYGGYAATVPKRNHYAKILRQIADSILRNNIDAKIVIMGDFNDYASNESMISVLNVQKFDDKSTKNPPNTLYNLMLPLERSGKVGSHKYEDFWGCLDQIIVSGNWLNSATGARQIGNAKIFKEDFLLVDDEKYGGQKNYRTFSGPRYIGGFSDHLPVYVLFRDD